MRGNRMRVITLRNANLVPDFRTRATDSYRSQSAISNTIAKSASRISYFGSWCHWDGRMYRETKDRAQSCETPRGDPWIDFPGRKKSEKRKKGEGTIFLQAHGSIRRTFCDGLVELAHCRSESRTCLMELEPFWKFDRREQPASRSSVPPLCVLLPSSSFVLTRSFSSLTSKSSSFSISCIPLRIRVAFPTLIWFRVLLFSSSVLCPMQRLRAVILETLSERMILSLSSV